MTLTASLRQIIRTQAGYCCEYCRLPQEGGVLPFHVDHVIPVKHAGTDDTTNLCLACYKCNGYKGSDMAGFDPLTGELSRLFHPRKQRWEDHFRLEADMQIMGLSPEGRTTVWLLRMNDDELVEKRQLLAEVGLYPC